MKLSYLFACLSVGTALIGGGISTQAFAQNNNVQNNNAHANIASKVAPSVHTQEVSIPPLTKIDEKGYVYNSQGICNARIDKKGNIVDGHNRNLGRIYKNGTIYNAKNENVGSVGKKGIIYSPTKTMIGKIDKKGEVFNSNNVKVGQVAKNHKSAAVLLLLNANDVFSQY